MKMTPANPAQMTVRFKFSVKPVKLPLLGAIVLQVFYFMRDLMDFITNTVFRFINEGKSVQLPALRNNVILLPATELAAHIRKRKLTSEEVVKAYIDRIKDINPIVNAVVDQRFDTALLEAQAVDRFVASGKKTESQMAKDTPFLGVPITIKENFQVEGLKQTVGLVLRKDCVSTEDALAVKSMKCAGAIILAVTNLSELCTWWESNNCVYGRTRNPYDTTRIVGGSSGGEGCIVGSAGSCVGIGSDVGGSIRLPAFFNGVFGHKPTMGVVKNLGQKPELSEELQSYLVTGPLCRYACDLIPTFKVLAGPSASQLKLDEPVNLKTLKVYYMKNDGGFPLVSRVNTELRGVQRRVILHLEQKYKIRAQEVHFPSMVRGLEMWANTLYGLHKHTFCEEMNDRKGSINVFLELMKWSIGLSTHTLPALVVGLLEKLGIGKNKKELAFMTDMCSKLQKEFQEMLGEDGIFLYPSHPTLAPYHNQPLFQPANFVYAAIFNILGLPVTQCPLGLSTEGLPLGIQVVANMYNDRLSLAVAQDLEKGFGGWVPPFPIPT